MACPFTRTGHLPDGLENLGRLDGLVAAFFRAPDADAVDAGCMASMRPTPFAVDRSGS